MTYIDRLNAFWNWRKINELSSKQADLYFAILDCANASKWKSEFTAPNSTLMGMCSMCKSELHKNRNVLIQKGLVSYKNGKKGTAGVYCISPLYKTNIETHVETNIETHVETNPRNIQRERKRINNSFDKSKECGVKPKPHPPAFVPPTIEQIREYCKENGYVIDISKFHDHFTAVGWKINGNPMADWQARLRKWASEDMDKEFL
jgi:hypothetical protein